MLFLTDLLVDDRFRVSASFGVNLIPTFSASQVARRRFRQLAAFQARAGGLGTPKGCAWAVLLPPHILIHLQRLKWEISMGPRPRWISPTYCVHFPLFRLISSIIPSSDDDSSHFSLVLALVTLSPILLMVKRAPDVYICLLTILQPAYAALVVQTREYLIGARCSNSVA